MRKLLLIAALILCGASSSSSPAQQPDSAGDIFGLTAQHAFHVTLTADDYAKMDPAPPQIVAPAPGASRPAPGGADFGAGNFGFDFPYVSAKIDVDGQTFPNVGLRYKGSGTYLMSMSKTKRSLKIDFDRFDPNLTYRGVAKLNLNSGVMDPTKAREALAYKLFNALGVPAPKTAFAVVTLTVPKKFDAELLGVFTVVQQVNEAFLKDHFGDSTGLLLKPEGIRGLPHFGDDPKAYETTYGPKSEADEASWRRLIELTRLINNADEEEFRAHIGEYLDLDAFARFIAANAALASHDGFLGLGHNFYLYLAPQTGKFVFFPWDLDLAFGAFPFYGSAEQIVDLSIDHPHVGNNKLIDRLMAMPEWKAAYREQLRRISDELFTPETIGKDLAAVEAALKTALADDKAAAEKRRETGGGGFFGGPPPGMTSLPLASFIERRKKSIDDQLAGKTQGFVPTENRGFFGAPPPKPGDAAAGPPTPQNKPADAIAAPLFAALDDNHDGRLTEPEVTAGMTKLIHEWDANKDGALDKGELAEGLQKLSAQR